MALKQVVAPLHCLCDLGGPPQADLRLCGESGHGLGLGLGIQALTPDSSLMIQQPLLAPQAPAVAAQIAVGADHAVTRHDDRKAVVAVCATDGT